LLFCAREGITAPTQLTSRVLDRLGADLRDTGGARGELSAHSIHAYLRPVNSFLTWANNFAIAEVGAPRLLVAPVRRF
jgi:hypothetical protein